MCQIARGVQAFASSGRITPISKGLRSAPLGVESSAEEFVSRRDRVWCMPFWYGADGCHHFCSIMWDRSPAVRGPRNRVDGGTGRVKGGRGPNGETAIPHGIVAVYRRVNASVDSTFMR